MAAAPCPRSGSMARQSWPEEARCSRMASGQGLECSQHIRSVEDKITKRTDVGVELLVDVDEDSRVRGAVRTRNLDRGRFSRAAAGDLNLVAGHVESTWTKLEIAEGCTVRNLLCTTDRASDVESYTIVGSGLYHTRRGYTALMRRCRRVEESSPMTSARIK